MRIAILGAGYTAHKAYLHFSSLEADVVVIDNNETTEFDFGGSFLKAQIKRVHKKFLDQDEATPKNTRMCDLFRVVVERCELADTSNLSNKAKEKLGADFMHSLESSIEEPIDVDVVIDTRELPFKFAGAGGEYALGEEKAENLYYAKNAVDFCKENKKSKLKLGLIGSGAYAVECLSELLPSIEAGLELTLFTNEVIPFEKIQNESFKASAKLENINAVMAKLQKSREGSYQKQIEEFKQLELHEQAKLGAPKKIASKVKRLSAVNIMSIDQLVDREGLFVTIERPAFRGDNALDESIGTYHFDALLICTGHKKELSQEEGYYYLSLAPFQFEQTHSIIKMVETDIMRYFKKI